MSIAVKVINSLISVLLTGTVLSGCGRDEAPSHRGGIWYEIRWGGTSARLATPAGLLPTDPVAIDLRVGDEAVIVGVNKATPPFDQRYSLSTDGIGPLSVAGATMRADRIGDVNVWIAPNAASPATPCSDGASRCRLVLIHVLA